MFRRTIRFGERTDVRAETERLREQALKAHVGRADLDRLVAEFNQAATVILAAGTRLKGQGSQMSVSRCLEGPGYAINLTFETRTRARVFERMMQVLRLR